MRPDELESFKRRKNLATWLERRGRDDPFTLLVVLYIVLLVLIPIIVR